MEFLLMWLGTIIASFGMEMKNEFRLFKDVADAGYKVDTKKLSEIQKQLNPEGAKNVMISLLCPFINIMGVFDRIVKYNSIRPFVLTQLNIMDVLDEMSEIEKEEYEKKPTGLNALLVPIKYEARLKQANVVSDAEDSKIYFEFDKNVNEIIILKSTGKYANLNKEEQIEIIQNVSNNMMKKIVKEFVNSLGKDIVIAAEESETALEDSELTKRKQELYAIKKYLTDLENSQFEKKEEVGKGNSKQIKK